MDKVQSQKTLKQTLRHYVRAMAFVVCGIVIIGSVGTYYARTHQVPQQVTTIDIPVATRSQPIRLRIPALAIDTTFVPPLLLNADQTVSVPDSYTRVGWYANGPTPGEVGPAVILGHVDSKDGPAIFYPLGRLKRGDTIEVEKEDKTVAIFEVVNLVRYPQDSFPTEEVYGKTDLPTLRLVTCTGIFNKGIQRYSHNLVVYATLKTN